ncbi:hypothetical protein EDD15DRAFT_2196811 [Pisolithus albus]|nr:hypothetical protein EDD15DRAFT_2196811 [Pisolithus albus]
MSEQQQCKVRFYHQVDIMPISPRHPSRTSSVQPKDMHSASSQGRMPSKKCPSIEALSLYGDESPSPPAEMSTTVRCPSPSPHLSLFERMKGAEVPHRPPMIGSLHPKKIWRWMHAQVPVPPSPPQEWVPLPKEDWEMELASSGSKAVQLPTSPPSLSLFERMKHTKVPMPPSPPCDWVPPSFQVAEVDMRLPLPSMDGPVPHSPFKDLHVDQGDEPDHGLRIDFGDPERGWLREKFDTGMRGPTPTYGEHQELVQSGLATMDTEDYGTFTHAPRVQIEYPQVGFDIQAYTDGPPYPSRQSVIKMATIYLGLWIECAMFHLLGMLRVSDWLAEWFSNLCLDLKELEHLVLVTVSRESYPPTLPACFHTYLHCQGDKDRFQEEIGSIPPGAFRMVDQLGSYIPDWTPRTPNKYDGFVFPWWLQGSSQYAQDFQKLRGGKIFKIAYEYFQLDILQMGDQIDGWIEAKFDRFMKSLWEVAEQIEGKEGDVKHLLARWAALSRLVGMPYDISLAHKRWEGNQGNPLTLWRHITGKVALLSIYSSIHDYPSFVPDIGLL